MSLPPPRSPSRRAILAIFAVVLRAGGGAPTMTAFSAPTSIRNAHAVASRRATFAGRGARRGGGTTDVEPRAHRRGINGRFLFLAPRDSTSPAHRKSSPSVEGRTATCYARHRAYPSFIMKQTSFGFGGPPPSSRIAMKASSTAYSSDAHSIASVESLSDEEKAAYRELSLLSAKIRHLDEVYYGGVEGASESEDTAASIERSDDEYDALARREAEICTSHPNLLSLLEEESGLGKKATRFGGRVGRILNNEDDREALRPNDESSETKADATRSSSKSKKATAKKRVKRRHLEDAPMQSLDNAMDDAGAVAWLNRVRRLLLSSADDDVGEGGENYTRRTFPVQIMAEPKIDGLSLSLRYRLRNSTSSLDELVYKFVWGATRGDGTQGEDVTAAARSAWMADGAAAGNPREGGAFSVPESFAIPTAKGSSSHAADPAPALVEVRGEVVLPQKAFDVFTQNVTATLTEVNGDKNATAAVRTFSNARNAASGILLRSKEPNSVEEMKSTRFLQSHLQFYAYDIVASSGSESGSTSLDTSSTWFSMAVGEGGNEMRDALGRLGFRTPTPVAFQPLDMSLDAELNETDIPDLLEYHRSLMAARDESIAPKSSDAIARKQKFTNKQDDIPYQIDGVVYKLSSFHDRRICGSSSRSPRWAIAHKFPPQCAVTRLVDIEVQVGRTGALTPVAILEPANLGGAVVSRASLHNFHHARKLLLPKDAEEERHGPKSENDGEGRKASVRKGVSVLVSRAGDVIPQVVKRVFEDDGEDTFDYEMISLEAPQKCPACDSPTTFDFVIPPRKKAKMKSKKKSNPRNESDRNSEADTPTASDNENEEEEDTDEATSGQVLRCSGPQLLCPPRASNALTYAYSRAGLDVKGLSKSKLRHLIEEGIVRFPSDLFTVFGSKNDESSSKEEESLNEIADLPGWGAQSAQNLAESVRFVAAGGVPLSRYIYSLGIPLVGTHASQLVASTYGNVDSFLEALEEASRYDELSHEANNDESGILPFAALTGEDGSGKVKGIGPMAISALVSFSKEEVLVKAARDLANVLTIHDDSSCKISDVSHEGSNPKTLQFEGMSVVFTGTLPDMSRAVAQNRVKELGAKSTPNTVSKATSLVVEGDNGGKKARQARELGVRVIDSSTFMKLIRNAKQENP